MVSWSSVDYCISISSRGTCITTTFLTCRNGPRVLIIQGESIVMTLFGIQPSAKGNITFSPTNVLDLMERRFWQYWNMIKLYLSHFCVALMSNSTMSYHMLHPVWMPRTYVVFTRELDPKPFLHLICYYTLKFLHHVVVFITHVKGSFNAPFLDFLVESFTTKYQCRQEGIIIIPSLVSYDFLSIKKKVICNSIMIHDPFLPKGTFWSVYLYLLIFVAFVS